MMLQIMGIMTSHHFETGGNICLSREDKNNTCEGYSVALGVCLDEFS